MKPCANCTKGQHNRCHSTSCPCPQCNYGMEIEETTKKPVKKEKFEPWGFDHHKQLAKITKNLERIGIVPAKWYGKRFSDRRNHG